ncbi:hypothetical protein EHQ05_06740 [Leptospira yasudae]|uniref:LA_3751/LA_3752 family putative glycosyltransferase n=1 Tax=Leptospira yasudae TaxID=2202201 RepID=UPI00108360D5|nr:hypothetical protein [Leptospira yasudae]TGK30635.1 hypothetical protein EHQ05_06740 [Leptospira yasudae]TGM03985.1 hypothetical protein EHQ86_11995 [Leptospira yasudae]
MKFKNFSYESIQKTASSAGFKIAALILLFAGSLTAAYYTKPDASFAADSLMKVLQAKGWVESDFRSQEVFYLGKRIDSEFHFFPIATATTEQGEKIGPFPIANTLITAPFVWLNHPGWLIYLCAILFCTYIILLYTMTKRFMVSIAAVFATPLFHHFISFSDVAVAALLILLAVLFVHHENSLFSGNHTAPMFLSGTLIGLSCWYRPEALILAVCLCGSAVFAKLFSKQSRFSEDWKHITAFLCGFALIFSTFVLYNFLNYGSFLGPRVSSNQSISDFNFSVKVSSIQSLLFAGNGRLGFFGYSPWYVFILLFGFWKWKKASESVRIWILTFCTNLIAVGILTPNDSNIDWGSRYLTCSVFIPLLLLNEIKVPENPKKWIRNLILLGIGILIFYSVNVNLKVIPLMRKIAIQLDRIQNAIPWDRSKVFITQKIHIANTFGLNYLSQTILLIRGPKDLEDILRSHPKETFFLVEDQLDKSLSSLVREKFSAQFVSKEIPSREELLHLTEVTPEQNKK